MNKAHLDLAQTARERILVTSFLLGLYDRQLASSLAVAKIKDSSEAEKLAAEGVSVRKDMKNRKSYMNNLAVKDLAESEDPDEKSADPGEPQDLDEEEEEEIPAALHSTTPVRRGPVGERSKATAATKCFNVATVPSPHDLRPR